MNVHIESEFVRTFLWVAAFVGIFLWWMLTGYVLFTSRHLQGRAIGMLNVIACITVLIYALNRLLPPLK